MAFRVILTATPTEDLFDVRLSLDFSLPSRLIRQADLAFGRPSKMKFPWLNAPDYFPTQEHVFEFGKRAVPFDVAGAIQSGDDKVGFSLRNLFSNDSLYVIALSRKSFLGSVFHDPNTYRTEFYAPCIATCADGTSGQDCVTCVSGNVTVKICC